MVTGKKSEKIMGVVKLLLLAILYGSKCYNFVFFLSKKKKCYFNLIKPCF